MLHLKTIALLFSITLIGCTSSPHAWQGQSGSKRVFIELETTPDGTSQAFLSLPEQWVEKAKADTLVLSERVFSLSLTGRISALKVPSVPARILFKQK